MGQRKKDFCIRGHDLNDPTIGRIRKWGSKKGFRYCILCKRLNQLDWYYFKRDRLDIQDSLQGKLDRQDSLNVQTTSM